MLGDHEHTGRGRTLDTLTLATDIRHSVRSVLQSAYHPNIPPRAKMTLAISAVEAVLSRQHHSSGSKIEGRSHITP